jgi:hypothetical protein
MHPSKPSRPSYHRLSRSKHRADRSTVITFASQQKTVMQTIVLAGYIRVRLGRQK